MIEAASTSLFGSQLRQWRNRSGVSQMELALRAQTTPRYISFIETGRSRPGREVVLRLASALDIPLKEQNRLLLLAGLKPAFPHTPLEDPAMRSINLVLEQILKGHEPFPAWVIAQGWRFIKANQAAERLFPGLCSTPPEVMIDRWFGPGPFRDQLENFAEVAWVGLAALRRETLQSQDPTLVKLLARAQAHTADLPKPSQPNLFDLPVVCPKFRFGDQLIRTITSVMRFDTAVEVNTAELKVELMFPADETSEVFFRNMSGVVPND